MALHHHQHASPTTAFIIPYQPSLGLSLRSGFIAGTVPKSRTFPFPYDDDDDVTTMYATRRKKKKHRIQVPTSDPEANIVLDILEASASFLSRPVPIPSFSKKKPSTIPSTVALGYPLSLALLVAVLPLLTSILINTSYVCYMILSKGIQSSLLSPGIEGELLEEQDRDVIIDDDDDNENVVEMGDVLDFLVFFFSIVSGGLSSPMGFTSMFNLFSVVPVISLGLAFAVILQAGNDGGGGNDDGGAISNKKSDTERYEEKVAQQWEERLEESNRHDSSSSSGSVDELKP